MTTLAQLRRTALSLPETSERRLGSGVVEFTVRGEPFAASDKDGRVHLHLAAPDADRVLSEHPAAERVPGGDGQSGVRVPFEDIDGRRLNHWVRHAWLAHAPEDLAGAGKAADDAVAGEVGDLPRSIGTPATRALVAAGVTSLADVAGRTEAELLELHGMGPKAVRVLGEALAGSGRSFRS
ncbi:hypothetical protein [Streptosporangium sp. NPDC023615]|uniref:hypothetical protein n=1 Tax=Streptosporangium sp. NPDC023615 TaxID=3154794 RepID=UPI00341CB678